MIEKFEHNNYLKNTVSKSAILASVSMTVLLIACAFGEGISGSFGSNPSCYKYLGCTEGFFGYDALEHLISGIALTLTLIWFFKTFPKYSILSNVRWKNILIILSLIALFSVMWELAECVHDVFRLAVLHQPLLNFKLHINLLDQPNNLDTMGDMFFEILGSVIVLLFVKI